MSKLKKTKQQLRLKSNKKSPKVSQNFGALKPGDRIEILAPASHAPFEHLLAGARILETWGFRVTYDPHILKPDIFLSNSDEYRFTQLMKAFNDPDVNAIWCLRGGYGSIRLLPFLHKAKRVKFPKLLIGLSDVSSLQLFLAGNWNFPSLHTALIDRIGLEKLSRQNIEEIRNCLMNPNYIMSFENLRPLNKAAHSKATVRGKVIGGNLMVVTSTLGTPTQPNATGKILFFEELAERSYRIDRCLNQLEQAGVFKKAKAVVFGDFTSCNEPNGDNFVQEVLEKFFSKYKIPVYSGIENGHGELQRPLFFNTEAELSCGNIGSLKVFSPFSLSKKK